MCGTAGRRVEDRTGIAASCAMAGVAPTRASAGTFVTVAASLRRAAWDRNVRD
jgi:hypothetical protein